MILDFDGVFVITTSLFSSLVKVKGSSTSPTELYLQSKIILNAVNKFVHIMNNIYDVIQATIKLSIVLMIVSAYIAIEVQRPWHQSKDQSKIEKFVQILFDFSVPIKVFFHFWAILLPVVMLF